MSQFLQQVRQTTRRVGLADATEQSYTGWIRRYILFHHFQSTDEISRSPRADIEAFLIHLADEQQLSASSINQALSALIFLYKQVLQIDLPYLSIPRPRSVKALQLPLDDAEAAVLLSHLSGETYLLAALMYGAGLRVKEACSLRVQNLDFNHHKILAAETKGGDHRITLLPRRIVEPLQAHLKLVRNQHDRDRQQGHGYVWLPPALHRKYPNAEQEWPWQYVFPSRKLSRHRREPDNPTLYRFHISPSTVAKQIKRAAQAVNIDKRVTPHILRHSFAVSMRKRGYSIEQIQKLMGHKSTKTTQYHYLRSIEPDIEGIRGPMD
jgi:integron integrase